jgi:hypothetical protein
MQESAGHLCLAGQGEEESAGVIGRPLYVITLVRKQFKKTKGEKKGENLVTYSSQKNVLNRRVEDCMKQKWENKIINYLVGIMEQR